VAALVMHSVAAAATVSSSLTLLCPAKLNLFLRVVRRRDDGFHDLASLFQTLSLGDRLTLQLAPEQEEDSLACDAPGVPTDASNLVRKALDLFKAKADIPDVRFAATLLKRTPAEAGLGGGSSDAAAALFGANALCGFPASEQDLLEWAGDIGSDISFFFSGGTAYCTGRGEIVRPVAPLPNPPEQVWLVKPPEGLSTPKVFKTLDLEKRSTLDPEQLLEGFMQTGTSGGILVNDLEPPAFECLPSLAELKGSMKEHGFDKVLMSGSGTTLFAIGPPSDESSFTRFCEDRNLFHCKTSFTQREAGSKTWYAED